MKPRATSACLVMCAATLSACCYLPAPAPSAGGGAGSPATAPSAAPTPPPGTEATLSVLQVILPNNKETGVAWDIGGGAPDPYAVIRQGGITLLSTERVQDSLAARWEPGLLFNRTLPLEIAVYDRDVSADDAVGSVIVQFDPSRPLVDEELTYWGGSVHLEMR